MQQINTLQDRLRASVNVGKWRARVLKLGYERTMQERERRQAIVSLGTWAWEQRIEHPDYADLFAQLLELDQQYSATQVGIDSLKADIQREEDHKQQIEQQSHTRLHDIEQQKQAALARQADQAEIEQYDQQIATIKTEQQLALQPVLDHLAELRQHLRNQQDQLASLDRQLPALQQNLGEAVNRVRPQQAGLAEHYVRLDTLDQELARLASEIDTLNQQIAAAGTDATKTLYWLAGGVAVVVLVLGLLISNGLSMAGGGGGVSERQMREDMVGQTLYTPFIGIDLAWDVAEEHIRSFDIVERKTDLDAGTEYIRAQMELADNLLTVSAMAELEYKQYEQGWRLEDMEVPDWDGQLAIIHNPHEPSLNRMGKDIERKMHSTLFSGCDDGDPVNLRHSKAYGGISSGDAYETVYELNGSACDVRGTWLLRYRWDGNTWTIEEVQCIEGDSSYCMYYR